MSEGAFHSKSRAVGASAGSQRARARFSCERWRMGCDRAAIVDQVRNIPEQDSGSEGLELVGAECKGRFKGGTRHVSINKPAEIIHLEYEAVCHQFSAVLDVEGLIPAACWQTVSSAGLDRKLSKPTGFARFANRWRSTTATSGRHGSTWSSRRNCDRTGGVFHVTGHEVV